MRRQSDIDWMEIESLIGQADSSTSMLGKPGFQTPAISFGSTFYATMRKKILQMQNQSSRKNA